ncbi:ATP-dependent RNA helicase DDX24 isoform X2 [Anarrhichthys ocellatus]|uniref:ATP-dependent RNA helicase DDX24 isoform X2 n=1 Tax=Anarrhichthys ocellatus TaxID=433405 RepID=UPI0012EDF664|nr:ATP-dependent RNA helicase DDX24 isoform X2 [Anarrhichthys ocellatus]
MKIMKMKPRYKRMSSGLIKPAKRSIHMKGKWKALELDPSIFSEEGLEGLVCFEELTDYRLVDSEKAAAEAANEFKKEKKKKKKTKKRKACEGEKAGEKVAVESKEGEKTAEPVQKKAKKRKNQKVVAQESDQPDNTAEEVMEKDVAAGEEGGEEARPVEDACKDTAISSEPDAPKLTKKSNKKKKKKPKRPIRKDKNQDSELQGLEIEKSTQDKVTKLPKIKKQIKNWTNAAQSGPNDKKADVSAWKDLFVPSLVLKALSSLGFSSPSPIQALTLPPAIRDRMDILGAAETGSGKTLAFGIPMIHAILEWKKSPEKPTDDNTESTAKVESLYLPAVDETGIEDDDEEDNVDAEGEEGEGVTEQDEGDTDEHDSEDDGEEKDDDERLGCVKVIENAEFDFEPTAEAEEEPAGGGSQPLLGLVLTPTRELAVQVKHHIDAVAKFTDIKTAILVGGMAQQKQRRMLKRRPEIVIATPGRLWDLIQEGHPHLQNLRRLRCLVIDEADRMVERGHFAELESLLEMLNTVHFNPKRQTFVFSATLTMDRSLPTRVLQKKKKKNLDQRSKLEALMVKVGIRSKPKIVDLTRKEATVETLTETRIHCQKEEKDFYLYYFLLQYPGRTMVFANSIDCIKRLNSLLVILDCTPLPLHANMHQKQRLKNLERFAERESCVLLTTDVAARGLDIPNVEHVIHYQVPRTSETYVHRSGRTARATKEGLSLLLIGPDDVMNFKKIYKALGKDEELPMFPIEGKCMEAIKERVNLARQIEKIEFHNSKEKQHNSWFRQAAEAMEVDLDDDLLIGRGKDEDDDREQQRAVKGMKKHLKHLISQPVFNNGIRTKYPTQMGKLSVPHMPVPGRGNALTRVSLQEKKQQKLKKGVAQQQKKEQQ